MNLSRPGLAKTKGERLVSERVSTWLRVSDGRFRAMFDAADAVSEGSVGRDATEAVWYGTTMLVLVWPPDLRVASRALVATLAQRDLHVRLRALRIAYREASLRAPGTLGRASCEVKIEARDEGLRIDVDVQAPLTLPSHLGVLR